jgi:hypothetical protein
MWEVRSSAHSRSASVWCTWPVKPPPLSAAVHCSLGRSPSELPKAMARATAGVLRDAYGFAALIINEVNLRQLHEHGPYTIPAYGCPVFGCFTLAIRSCMVFPNSSMEMPVGVAAAVRARAGSPPVHGRLKLHLLCPSCVSSGVLPRELPYSRPAVSRAAARLFIHFE